MMACFKQWMYFSAAVATYVGGGAAVIAGMAAEVGTAGAATPAAAATIIGGIAGMIAGLTGTIATEIDLIECYQAAGRTVDAEAIRARMQGHQEEKERLTALMNRLQSLVSA
jgi:hypothetical protein